MELRLILAPPQALACLLAAILAALPGNAAALSAAPPVPATVRACLRADPQTLRVTPEGQTIAHALRVFVADDIEDADGFSIKMWQGTLPTSNLYREDTHDEPTPDDRALVRAMLGDSFALKLTRVQIFQSSWPPPCDGFDMELRLHSPRLSCQEQGACVYRCTTAGCSKG